MFFPWKISERISSKIFTLIFMFPYYSGLLYNTQSHPIGCQLIQGQEKTLSTPGATSFCSYICELFECFREAWIFQDKRGDRSDIHMRFRMFVCIHIYMSVCVCIFLQVCLCICMFVCMYVCGCVYVHICVCVCMYIYVCFYISIYVDRHI